MTKADYLRFLACCIFDELGSLRSDAPERSDRSLTFKDAVRRFEESLIRNGLVVAHYNQRRAAVLLGMNPTTLNEKIKRYAIPTREEPSHSALSYHDTSESISHDPVSSSMRDALKRFEIEAIRSALRATGGHQTRAALLLGMRPTTLNTRIHKLEIDPGEFHTNSPDSILSSHLAHDSEASG